MTAAVLAGVGGAGGIAADLGLIVVAAVGLWFGSGLLVDGAVALAERVGLSGTVIGLTVVAVGTSAPELVVTFEAGLAGRADIAVGNVVGSNVFNLGFILGGLAVAGGVPTSPTVARRDGPVLLGVSVLVTAFLFDGHLGRAEGGVLVAVWVAYVLVLLWRQRSADRATVDVEEAGVDAAVEAAVPLDAEGLAAPERWPLWKAVGALAAGLVLLLGSARLLVVSASDLARLAGIGEWVIGLTVVAAGTSMPEFATAAAAARRGSHGVSVGTLLGSDLSNLLLALGGAAVLRPLTLGVAVLPNFVPLVLAVALVVGLSLSGESLSRRDGVLLVAVALARWIVPLL